MLRLKVYINEKEVDEIRIQNMNKKNEKGEYKYKVVKPKGYENITIYHDIYKPWHILIEKILHKLNKTDYNNLTNRVSEKLIEFFDFENKSKN